jgi:3-dehydroquinate dehydratase/shikimate dehydrogenase
MHMHAHARAPSPASTAPAAPDHRYACTQQPTTASLLPCLHRGNYEGEEAPRLATLKYAALMGAPFIDVEWKASATFFASESLPTRPHTLPTTSHHPPSTRHMRSYKPTPPAPSSKGAGEVPVTTKVILSNHNFTSCPEASALKEQAKKMYEAGADIVKIATMANDIVDAAKMLSILQNPIGEQKGQQTSH